MGPDIVHGVWWEPVDYEIDQYQKVLMGIEYKVLEKL